MIKLIIATRRRAGMTQAEFHHYLRHVHAPLVLGDIDSADLIRKYTQNHVFDAAYGAGSTTSYPVISERDIVTELWFDGIEQMAQGQHTPMYINVIRPDEDNFADQGSVLIFPAREREFAVSRPRTAPVKVIHYLKQSPESTLEDFAARWSEAHTAIMSVNPKIADGFAKYIQNYPLPNPHAEVAEQTGYGIAMLWLDSLADLGVFHTYYEQLAIIAAPNESFFDPTQSFFVLTEEFVVKEWAQ